MTASKTPAAPDVTLRQSARWLPADMDTPISLFLGMCHEHHGILLESAEVDGQVGTLQHSGLRLPASGRLPGRAAGPRHQRRPPAPLCRAQRDALHGRLAYAHARPAPRKTRGHHAAAHHPRPVRLFRLRHGELLQQEAGKLPAPKGRRRQPCSAGNRARASTTCTTGCARSASANTGT